MNETANDLPLGMTDLEEQLRAEGGQAVRDRAIETLDAAVARISGRINTGLSADEFKAATAIQNALAMARSLLEAYPARA